MAKLSYPTRAILKAYGYTTRTLAIDCDISIGKARRILHGKNHLWSSDLSLLKESILGVDMSFLFGQYKPGEMKIERERREAHLAEFKHREASTAAKRKAEDDERAEVWRHMTSQEKCTEIVGSVFIPYLKNFALDGCSIEDIAGELIRQGATMKKETAA